MTLTLRPLLRMLIAASLLLAPSGITASAQGAPEAALEAAFIYNFAKFTVWPPDASTGPLKMCVLGDTPIADALDAAVKGRPIDGRDVTVSRVKAGELRGCHVLYLAGGEGKPFKPAFDDLGTAPVLTVSDRHLFAESGGIAGLYVEGGKMKFAINVDAAQRAGLRISSRLLGLAKIVKDDHARS